MTWNLLDRPKTQKCTKALAKTYSEMEPAPHDRPLSERRLQVYGKLLANGEFRPVTWASVVCEETGEIYRVNGKHTSTLLAGVATMPEFYVTIEEYECDTLEDVAKLYATFDSKLMARTARDICASFAGACSELASVSLTTVMTAVSGMAYHLGIYDHQAAEKAELMMEHPEFVQWLAGIYSPQDDVKRPKGYADHIRRYPCSAAMFAGWQKSRSAATDFWTAVRDETGNKPSAPDRKLAAFLIRTGVNVGKGSGRTRRAEPREMYVRCLHAWNAWRKGEATDLKYYAAADLPAAK